MSEQPFAFLSLSYAARPPKTVLVAPHDDENWVAWAAVALARLSKVWGCSASVVIPAEAVGNPAVERCLARFNPDHVLAYKPSWATADIVRPGSIDTTIASLGATAGAVSDQLRDSLLQQPWNAPIVQNAEIAADGLRERCGTNRRGEHAQSSHLFDERADDDPVRELTSMAAFARTSLLGLPLRIVTTAESLAYAMHVGISNSNVEGSVLPAQWREAATRGSESPLLTQLHPGGSGEELPTRSHEAARCVAVTRALRPRKQVVVMGDRPEDFALAEVLRQIRGAVTWLPWTDTGLSDLWLFPPGKLLLVTSVSLTVDEVRERIEERWHKRPIQAITDDDERPFDVVHPDDIDLDHPLMVVLAESWDQPRSLPVTKEPDGTLQASLPLAAEVPHGLDPKRHRWQVTLTAPSHPVPHSTALNTDVVRAAGQNPWETFIRAADGGITYWSHRYDFVPSGASLAGALAAPRLAWPGIKRILHTAASAHDVRVLPSPAGKRTAITEGMVGSRGALEAIAAGPEWSLLRSFLPSKSDSQQAGEMGETEDGRWRLKSAVVLSWEAIESLDANARWELSARRALVDQWTAQGVLRRGLTLGCGHCPILEFYPLSEINQSYLCRRCGGSNQLAADRWRPKGAEPHWFYDLHPAVLELVDNDGDVPLLATRFIRDQHWARQALFCEEFELTRDGEAKPFVEMDFALTTSEGIWLGEAKSTDSLEKTPRGRRREASKLLEGCAVTGASHLILATSKERWAETTLDALREEVAGRRKVAKATPEVRLLTGLGTSPKLSPLTA
ncbi:hypothetical protein [Streptomyces sp. bgisy126]|uniref:hypothetical protein n=1 Tax=Streptomyces sp. bgisy126 TaxID=3413787 RepID=UPI003EB93238